MTIYPRIFRIAFTHVIGHIFYPKLYRPATKLEHIHGTPSELEAVGKKMATVLNEENWNYVSLKPEIWSDEEQDSHQEGRMWFRIREKMFRFHFKLRWTKSGECSVLERSITVSDGAVDYKTTMPAGTALDRALIVAIKRSGCLTQETQVERLYGIERTPDYRARMGRVA